MIRKSLQNKLNSNGGGVPKLSGCCTSASASSAGAVVTAFGNADAPDPILLLARGLAYYEQSFEDFVPTYFTSIMVTADYSIEVSHTWPDDGQHHVFGEARLTGAITGGGGAAPIIAAPQLALSDEVIFAQDGTFNGTLSIELEGFSDTGAFEIRLTALAHGSADSGSSGMADVTLSLTSIQVESIIPEPSCLALNAIGVVALAARRRRRPSTVPRSE